MDENTKKIMFSSKSDEWATPRDFFDSLNREFRFTLDPCASQFNHKCEKYYTVFDDGLKQDWSGESVFVNPPYSNVKEWAKKCKQEGQKPNTKVVLLIPSRTDTRYWHDYCMSATEMLFVKGRLKFGDQKNSAPFPSVVLVWDNSPSMLHPSYRPHVGTITKEGKW